MSATTPSRDDRETTGLAPRCPVCAKAFTAIGRQRYCQASCRKTAYRRRHDQPREITVPTARPRRPQTVYQCPDCDGLQVGVQRCQDCGVFGHSLGLGGTCPTCDQPVTLDDLGLSQTT